MFNHREIEKIQSDMEQIARDYHKAQEKLRTLKDQAAECAIAGEQLPGEIKHEIEEVKWDIELYPCQLQELKTDYIRMIESIKL